MSYQTAEPVYDGGAGRRALYEARQKIILHIGATSKELGSIAAQYGNVINNYQKELQQLDAALAALVPSQATDGCPQAQTPNAAPASPHYYNKY